MEQYYGYIYMTINLINNKKYIGKKKGKIDNWYLGSGIYLKRAINKYGKENFKKEILDICYSLEEQNQKEKEWIEKYNAVEDNMFYNIASGGDGGDIISNLSKSRKEALRQKHREKKGSLNSFYGRSHSKESIRRMMETKKSRGLLKESKKVDDTPKDVNNGMYGKRGENAINSKKLYQYQDEKHTHLIKEHHSITCAMEYLKIKGHSALYKAIKNNKKYKGYYWSKEKSATTISEESTSGDKHHLEVQSLTSI